MPVVACANPTDPSVIFFDEPTAGLDPIMDQTISALIRDIAAESKATALTITHGMTIVHSIFD
jgi:phospholipid/cholesterol/gamma-HCH transport system ATP-binding protein